MSGPENRQPDDTALEEFLAGRSEVSQAYREVAKEAPPGELDTAVLDFARRDAARAPAPGRFRRAGLLERWRWPVSAAAMMVLSLSVLNQVRHDRGARQATMLESSVPAAPPPAPLAASPDPELQEAPATAPPPARVAPSNDGAGLRREPSRATARAPAVIAAPESDAVTVAPSASKPGPPPAAEPFPAAPPAAQARAEEGSRKRLADQAGMQRRDGEAERRAQREAEARSQAENSMAKEERQGFAAQSAGSAAGPVDVVEAFLQRPSVQRLPASGGPLRESQRLLRQGRRRVDGTCDFPPPPAGQAGATVVELQLAVDIDTCEVLVERGSLRR